MLTHEVTIAGKIFPLIAPYEEGHALTAGEAAALNQVRHENVRNNSAKAVKDGKWGDEEVAKYDAEYVFGERKAGGGPGVSRDPVQTEARGLVKATLKAKLEAAGKALPKGDALNAAIAAILAGPKGQSFIDVATQRVAAKQAAAASLLDEISADDIPVEA